MSESNNIIKNLNQAKAVIELMIGGDEPSFKYIRDDFVLEVLSNIEERLNAVMNSDVDLKNTHEMPLINDIHFEIWQARGLMVMLTANDKANELDHSIVISCLENVADRIDSALAIMENPLNINNNTQPTSEININ